jgi:DNA-binding MarR family transcriptional regulator
MHGNLLLKLLGAVYWFDDALQDNLEAQGFPRLSRAISFILLNIAQGEHRAIKIARNLGITRQAVSLMLLGLRDRGVIDINEDPSDKRSQIVSFSPAFAKQGAACAEILVKLETELSRRVGADDFRVMKRVVTTDWGAIPMLHLSRKEIAHGKVVYEKQRRGSDYSVKRATRTRKVSIHR